MSDTDTPRRRLVTTARTPYLPVLPAGWSYDITLVGPSGERIRYGADGAPGGQVCVYVQRPGGADAVLHAADEQQAVRLAVDAARAIAAAQEQVRQAQEALAAALGLPAPTPAADPWADPWPSSVPWSSADPARPPADPEPPGGVC